MLLRTHAALLLNLLNSATTKKMSGLAASVANKKLTYKSE